MKNSIRQSVKDYFEKLDHQFDLEVENLSEGTDVSEERDLQYYLQNITKLDCQDIIFQTENGWYMNLHSPFDGEIFPEWRGKIIGVKKYDKAELYGINDSCFGAIYVLSSGNKKALFMMQTCDMMQGSYFSPDKSPFIYDRIEIFYHWREWNNFGYAVCEMDNVWRLVKITQYPRPNYDVVGDGFSSVEEAMRSIGIEDCAKYRDDRW